MKSFYEFFAGGGMVRIGLGSGWECVFANDNDSKKVAAYRRNFAPAIELLDTDIAIVRPDQLVGRADLAWASFPCQDLSLAGSGAGLGGSRSGTFWPFWRLIKELGKSRRAPSVVVLENVCGALTSHGGNDFKTIASSLHRAKYRFGAVVIDAIHWLPQSRPRLFIIAAHRAVALPETTTANEPAYWHPSSVERAYSRLPKSVRASWVWWSLPAPPNRVRDFADLIEEPPQGVDWHTAAETKRLLAMMSPVNAEKVREAKRLSRATNRRLIGGLYKRMRGGIQRAEVRFDKVSGCLRTPVGGSSRQTILVVDGGKVKSRLLSPREAARLMGLPEEYVLPSSYNGAYHLAGDGVAVDVVRFLAQNLLDLILDENNRQAVAA